MANILLRLQTIEDCACSDILNVNNVVNFVKNRPLLFTNIPNPFSIITAINY